MKKLLTLIVEDRFKVADEKSPFYYTRTDSSVFINGENYIDYKAYIVFDSNDGVWITMGHPSWKMKVRTFKTIN